MSEKPGLILVAGARGNQGGATARHLLTNGWSVRAMTRRLDSESSQALRGLGMQVVQGDYNDSASLERAMDGVYGVFMPGFQASMRKLLEVETRYGTAFLQVMKKAGVKHLVYASEAGAEASAALGCLKSKHRIEALIRELALPATILRHAFYLDWLAGPTASICWKGLNAAAKDARAFQVVCLDDAAAYAAVIFDNPQRFIGKSIEIAGDEVTHGELSQAYRDAIGKAPRPSRMPLWLLRSMGDFGRFVIGIPGLSSHADIAAIRATYPGLRRVQEAMRAARPMAYPPK